MGDTHAWKVANDWRSLANDQKGLLCLKHAAKKKCLDMTEMQIPYPMEEV